MKTIIAIFLMLHGLVHAILAMAPEPNAPEARFGEFFSRSWLLDRLGLPKTAGRPLAFVLAAMTTIGFIGTGLALLDFLVPFDWWPTLAIVSAAISLALLIIFWNLYVIVGVAIDLVILATPIFIDWIPE